MQKRLAKNNLGTTNRLSSWQPVAFFSLTKITILHTFLSLAHNKYARIYLIQLSLLLSLLFPLLLS